MFEMKYWDWLSIAKHLHGVEELSLLDQQRYDSYLRYGHEELLSMPDYRAAYNNILVAQDDLVDSVVPVADENPTIEAPSMEDNSVANKLALAVLSLSPVNFKVLAFVLLRTEEVSLTASAKKLGMDIRTYKKALVVLKEEKWLS